MFKGSKTNWKRIYIIAVHSKMKVILDGTRGYYAKQNKPIRERQLSYDLSDMRSLRGSAKGSWGVGREKNETRSNSGGRQTIRDLISGNKQGY